jgi:co-chaperonin GroES (HSP10)
MLIPLGNRVLLKLYEKPSLSLVVMPDMAKQRSAYFEVVGTGPDVKTVKVGEYVVIEDDVGLWLDGEGNEKLLVVMEPACVALYREDGVVVES